MIDWIRGKNSSKAHWALWVALAMLAGYGVFIGVNHAPVAAGADSGGYLNSARLLAKGKLTTAPRVIAGFNPENPWTHTPLGYQLIPGDTVLRPTYPIGLPLHYAAASLLAGWYWGPLSVSVLGALAVVIGCYLGASDLGVRPALAWAGAAALAVSPLLLFASFTPMSDVVACAWCTVSFLAALRSRRGPGGALLSGLAFSIAVVVRPANIIFLPVLIPLLWNWRSLFLAGAGALPGAVLNGLYNRYMWGSPFVSGYGSVAEAFGAKYFLPTLINYGETLPWALPILFVGIILLPFLPWKMRWREYSACVLWVLIFMVFYAFYEFTNTTWWFLRFVIPAFPAMVILGVSGIEAVVNRMPEQNRRRAGWAAAALLVTVSLGGSIKLARERHFMLMKEYQEPYVMACDWAKKNMPPNSLVACMQASTAFFYYTDMPILRWDATDVNSFAALNVALRNNHQSLYAVLLPFEVDETIHKRMPGEWTKLIEFRGVGVWKFQQAQ